MAITELSNYAGTEFHPEVVVELAKVIRGDFMKGLKHLGSANPFDGRGLAFGYL